MITTAATIITISSVSKLILSKFIVSVQMRMQKNNTIQMINCQTSAINTLFRLKFKTLQQSHSKKKLELFSFKTKINLPNKRRANHVLVYFHALFSSHKNIYFHVYLRSSDRSVRQSWLYDFSRTESQRPSSKLHQHSFENLWWRCWCCVLSYACVCIFFDVFWCIRHYIKPTHFTFGRRCWCCCCERVPAPTHNVFTLRTKM